MKLDAYLSIDYGNSSTRVNIAYKDKSGGFHTSIHTLSNRYGYLDENTLYVTEVPDYTEKNSKVFRTKHDIVCVGKICESECGTAIVKPTSTDKKFDSKFSEYATRLALMQGYMILSQAFGEPIEDLDVTWHMAVCLPAYDMQAGKEKMKELIMNIDTIDFIIPDVQKKINIDAGSIKVGPEGVAAFIGTVFAEPGVFRYKMKAVASKKVLVIDMGDGTTDISLTEGTMASNTSLHSIQLGGSTITHHLKKEMEQRYGTNFSLDAMQKASITGELQIGNRTIDITKDVERIRRRVALSVANEIKGYFDSLAVHIGEINYILLCGGGAMPQQGESHMKSYVDFVKEALHNMMNFADFLEMPIVKQKDTKGKEEEVPLNPRLLNVLGLNIINLMGVK